MADIDVERKTGGMAWLWWLLGLLLLGLVLWAVFSGGDEEEAFVEPAPVVTPTTTPEPLAQGPLCVSQVLSAPTTYIGQALGNCQMEVVEVPTDRGFWVEENGQRIFAIIIDSPAEEPKDINPGQQITLEEAVLRDRSFLPQIPGEPLDADTQGIIESQAEYFLTVDESNIQITAAGTPQPGTTPAQTAPGGGN